MPEGPEIRRVADRPCYRCGEVVVRDDAGGRGMFHCPSCQPAKA